MSTAKRKALWVGKQQIPTKENSIEYELGGIEGDGEVMSDAGYEGEQARDASSARHEEQWKQRRALAGQAARDARAEAMKQGRDELGAQRMQRVAYYRTMGVQTGIGSKLYDGVAEAMRSVLATELRIKVEGAGVAAAEGEGLNVQSVDTA